MFHQLASTSIVDNYMLLKILPVCWLARQYRWGIVEYADVSAARKPLYFDGFFYRSSSDEEYSLGCGPQWPDVHCNARLLQYCAACLGLPVGLEGPVMTLNGVVFLFFTFYCAAYCTWHGLMRAMWQSFLW